MSEGLAHPFFPELGKLAERSIHGVYPLNETWVMIANDRTFTSSMDQVKIIPDKGRVYTQLILFWFEKTKQIIQNHIVFSPDPNVMIVKQYEPISIELVVRRYACGSMWTDYMEGKRSKCGLKFPEHLTENQELKTLMITPILKTKEGWKDVSKEQILQEKLIEEKIYLEMEQKALLLFQKGEELLQKNKVILAEAKYHFGLDERGRLLLVDQIHTPDSSRLWLEGDENRKPIRFPDREEIIQTQDGYLSIKEPDEIRKKMRDRYIQIFTTLTGQSFSASSLPIKQRVLTRLKNAKMIQGIFISILFSDEQDLAHIMKIVELFKEEKIPYQIDRVQNSSQLEVHMKTFNQSLEPVVYVMVEGRTFSFAKQGALQSKWPVVCTASFMMEPIDSSILHTNVSVLTIQDPVNASISTVKQIRSLDI